MIGRDTFSALTPVLGPLQKNWLCHPLPLLVAVSMIPRTSKYVTFEWLLHAAFVPDKIWGYMRAPVGSTYYIGCRRCKTNLCRVNTNQRRG